ncbi:MAG TPA: phosphopantothenate/pantothenate synthetase [Nitrososphaeraceae archaeon]|jgi:4-phosphopantoate--beta-alanine ligase
MHANIPLNHPRFVSLMVREKLVDGMKEGIVVPQGLLAHGRGEAFDYLLGETTNPSALCAEKAACALLILSRQPVISVNGNTAALCCKEIVELSKLADAPLEINLFHQSQRRLQLIAKTLVKNGANQVLGLHTAKRTIMKGISSSRRYVDVNGISNADTVLLALEDGDRSQALCSQGKSVISIDLNPLSRTSQASKITIVDNLVRAIPNMINLTRQLIGKEESKLARIVSEFDNERNLKYSTEVIRNGIKRLY